MPPLAIKSAVTAVAALLLLASSASAASPMNANDTSDEVTISAKGQGPYIGRITVTSSRQRTVETFRICRHTGSAATQSNVRAGQRPASTTPG